MCNNKMMLITFQTQLVYCFIIQREIPKRVITHFILAVDSYSKCKMTLYIWKVARDWSEPFKVIGHYTNV